MRAGQWRGAVSRLCAAGWCGNIGGCTTATQVFILWVSKNYTRLPAGITRPPHLPLSPIIIPTPSPSQLLAYFTPSPSGGLRGLAIQPGDTLLRATPISARLQGTAYMRIISSNGMFGKGGRDQYRRHRNSWQEQISPSPRHPPAPAYSTSDAALTPITRFDVT